MQKEKSNFEGKIIQPATRVLKFCKFVNELIGSKTDLTKKFAVYSDFKHNIYVIKMN